MRHAFHRLALFSGVMLVFTGVAPSQALPASAVAAAHCQSAQTGGSFLPSFEFQGELQKSALPDKPRPDAPIFRVIYPNCGVYCSDSSCSGAYNNDSCFDAMGRQGHCIPHNVFCPNEPQHSPCACEATGGSSCIASGGRDDVLYQTDCCSGQAVPGSISCTNPADYGTTWASCTQTCA